MSLSLSEAQPSSHTRMAQKPHFQDTSYRISDDTSAYTESTEYGRCSILCSYRNSSSFLLTSVFCSCNVELLLFEKCEQLKAFSIYIWGAKIEHQI
jgi:hypothetical protein